MITDKEKAEKIVNNIFSLGLNINRSFYDMAYDSAIEMAAWKEQQMIEKTIEFFKENSHVNCGFIDDVEIDKFADEYVKYMKGEN
jgi:hypothetical protein